MLLTPGSVKGIDSREKMITQIRNNRTRAEICAARVGNDLVNKGITLVSAPGSLKICDQKTVFKNYIEESVAVRFSPQPQQIDVRIQKNEAFGFR